MDTLIDNDDLDIGFNIKNFNDNKIDKQLPNIQINKIDDDVASLESLKNDANKIINLYDLKSDLIKSKGICKEDIKLIQEYIPNLLNDRVILESFTNDKSKFNFDYVIKQLDNKIALEYLTVDRTAKDFIQNNLYKGLNIDDFRISLNTTIKTTSTLIDDYRQLYTKVLESKNTIWIKEDKTTIDVLRTPIYLLEEGSNGIIDMINSPLKDLINYVRDFYSILIDKDLQLVFLNLITEYKGNDIKNITLEDILKIYANGSILTKIISFDDWLTDSLAKLNEIRNNYISIAHLPEEVNNFVSKNIIEITDIHTNINYMKNSINLLEGINFYLQIWHVFFSYCIRE